MAKRDKLYTVNKWNKPFFEEERKRKLYAWGGFNPYVHEGLASQIYGYGNTGGIDAGVNMPSYLSKAFKSFDEYKNPTQSLARVYNVDNANTIGSSNPTPQASPIPEGSKDNTSNTVGNILNTVNNVADAAKTAFTYTNPAGEAYESTPKDWGNENVSLEPKGANLYAQHGNLAAGLFQKLTGTQGPKYALSGTEGFNSAAKEFNNWIDKQIAINPNSPLARTAMQQKVANASIAKPSLLKGTTNITKSGITPLGKAGINLGASVLGKGAKYLLSNGLSTGIGEGIGTIADAASTIVQFIPGVGWAAAPIISFAGNALAGAWNGAFGSKTFDNGATAYTNRLNAINPNGSNEYIANLLASTGLGPRATYKDGWLRDKGKNEAAEINNTQDLAFNRFQRGARDAILNNNFLQTQYALNAAMGGKLNRKKCNCKADGGFLNSGINPSTPAGYDILQTSLIEQKAKNQANQNISGNIGNSFTSKLFSGGGYTNPLLQELMTVKPISSSKQLDLNSILGRDEYGVYPLNEIVVEAQRPAYALTGEDPYPIPSRYIPQSEVTAKYTDSPVETYDNSVILESNGKPIIGGYVRVANSEGHTRNKNRYKGKFEPNNVLYDYEPGDTLLDLTLDYTGTGTALGLELSGLPLHAVDAILGYPRRHYMRNGRYSEPFYAKGGPINIKKSHRGRLTELKKRTGKTEAELYNDGNPAHKKMVTFARNARKWKKAYGGFIDAANNLSEIEKTLYGNEGTLETKDKDYRNNSIFNGPTLFALGGVYQAAGSNWGRATETQTLMSNKGYNVGDVIEIDEAEAELLKKLGYEYKVVG